MTTRELHNQFIFREFEFEDDAFNASTFVAKYRRVSSLESLKEQLRSYCEALKKELFVIINRDYKDFITIATKLDGVGIRVEHLSTPLVDLRLDLSSLYDGLVSSTRAIEDKLQHRTEVTNKRKMLESSIMCIKQLDIAESIVEIEFKIIDNENNKDEINENITKTKSIKRRGLLQRINQISVSIDFSSSLSRDFECSEFERGAFALAHAQNCIGSINAPTNSDSNSSSSSSLVNHSVSSSPGLLKSLEHRMTRLTESLIQRLKTQLISILSQSSSILSSTSLNSSFPESVINSSNFPTRSFTHCLRALLALSRGDIAESVVANSVVLPFIKSTLTQGRVDGSSGRGSYSCLSKGLEGIVRVLKAALQPALEASEEISMNFPLNIKGKSIDLIVNGIWVPITSLLVERFPGIFSAGIASIFGRCYVAVDKFNNSLKSISGENWKKIISDRLEFHPFLIEFHGKWKLELYYQLRMQEITKRIDKSCSLAVSQGLMTNMLDQLYGNLIVDANLSNVAVNTPSNSNIKTVPAVSVGSINDNISISTTLSSTEIDDIKTKMNICMFNLPFISSFVIEMVTCLHSIVLLRALGGKLFSLALMLINRLEVQISVMFDTTTPAISRNDLSNLQTIVGDYSLNKNITQPSTPAKKSSNSTINTPNNILNPPIINSNNSNYNGYLTVEEHVLLSSDLNSLSAWLKDYFISYVESSLGLSMSEISNDNSPVYNCINLQCNKLNNIRSIVWSRVSNLLGNECKRNLTSVKAIAGKYRMTNKPLPDSSSPYVEIILQPYR
jgi:hypothetical protein